MRPESASAGESAGVLETAFDPAHPQALRALLGRVRAEALERAYPEVIVHAPVDHPVLDFYRTASGRVFDQDSVDGQVSMYHVPDAGRLLKAILPELALRASQAGVALPLELGVTVGDQRWLIHIEGKSSRVEPDKLSRRHLALSQATFVRLVMGHTGVDAAASEESFSASTATALDAARTPLPGQDPAPLDYLRVDEPAGFDIAVEVSLNGEVVSRPPYSAMYWSPAQMLAHMTVNGASLRTGDLFASGTISGDGRDQRGSFLELSWGGTEPFECAGSTRTFLEDGDVVTLRATAPGTGGGTGGGTITLGEVTGRIIASCA